VLGYKRKVWKCKYNRCLIVKYFELINAKQAFEQLLRIQQQKLDLKVSFVYPTTSLFLDDRTEVSPEEVKADQELELKAAAIAQEYDSPVKSDTTQVNDLMKTAPLESDYFLDGSRNSSNFTTHLYSVNTESNINYPPGLHNSFAFTNKTSTQIDHDEIMSYENWEYPSNMELLRTQPIRRVAPIHNHTKSYNTPYYAYYYPQPLYLNSNTMYDDYLYQVKNVEAKPEIDYTISLENVLNNKDKRTTVMIKNIPNKYTQWMLLSKIDEGYKGLYDFFYLPIDLYNNCNVGYAFINFVLPIFILKFYEDFNGHKWNKFNSGKVFWLVRNRSAN